MKKLLILVAFVVFCLAFGSVSRASQVIDLETGSDLDAGPTVNPSDTDPSYPEYPEYPEYPDMPDTVEPTTEATTEGSNPIDDMFPNTDTEIGDDLLPDVNPTEFFQRIYNKFNSGLVFWQKIIIYILIGFMCLFALMVVVSWCGNRSNVVWYLLGLFVAAIMCTCVFYAPEITAMFTKWLVS